MIRVTLAAAPPDFDARVRTPGLDALAELVGERPSGKRSASRRRKIADSRESIPPAELPPYWREVLPDMLRAYRRICAYLSLYIERGTGSPTVDHVVPKSKEWDRVYEWSNYRLACALMNARKSDVDAVLDPFEIQDDWFALELVDYQVIAGDGTSRKIARRVEDTIRQLKLNDQECCKARGEYVESYLESEIRLPYLERRAPFIARELRRLGKLRPGDG